MFALTAPVIRLSISLPPLWPPCSLRPNSSEIRPFDNPTTASKCTNKRKSHVSLTLHQKLEMIKLSEEETSNAKIGGKLGILHQIAKLWMQRNSSWKKLKCCSSEHTNGKKAKPPSCREGESFRGLDRRSSQPQHPLSQSLILSKALTLFNSMKPERWGSCRRRICS